MVVSTFYPLELDRTICDLAQQPPCLQPDHDVWKMLPRIANGDAPDVLVALKRIHWLEEPLVYCAVNKKAEADYQLQNCCGKRDVDLFEHKAAVAYEKADRECVDDRKMVHEFIDDICGTLWKTTKLFVEIRGDSFLLVISEPTICLEDWSEMKDWIPISLEYPLI